MRYTHVFFDLDGTLVDPFEGITKSIVHSLKYFDISVEDRHSLENFIGPPLYESYMKYFGFTVRDTELAVKYYREYYSVTGVYENTIYPEIPELLLKLRSAGLRLAVATSKPKVFSEKIVEKFHLAKYFDFISGSELDGTRVKKSEVIEYAIENMSIEDRSAVLMVGDRLHDIKGARESSVTSVGVLWGYGSREEHENAGADFICESVTQLGKLIIE